MLKEEAAIEKLRNDFCAKETFFSNDNEERVRYGRISTKSEIN